MLRCVNDNKIMAPQAFSKGDSVEFLKGLFTNFLATDDTLDAEQRVWVLLDFMGKNTRVKVLLDQLHKKNRF